MVVAIGLVFRAYTVSILGRDAELYLVKHRDMVTPYMLSLASPVLAAFVFVSIVAAAVSTANSIVLSVASSITRDLYERRKASPNPVIAKTIALASIAIMSAAAASIALAKLAFIVELSVLSSALLLPLAPVTIVGLYAKPGRRGALPAIIAIAVGSSTIFVAALAYGAKKALVTTWLGLPLPLWSLIISTLISLTGLVKARS